MDQVEVLAAILERSMYSDEERAQYSKIIADFNKLYHKLDRQTWCATQWKGINVLKPPTDLWVYQEIIERLKPELIIETGSMRGGSAVFLDDVCKLMNPDSQVISIDINKDNINPKAFESDVIFMTGSSVDEEIVDQLKAYIKANEIKKVMVILDSDHSEEHVTNELNMYGPMVTKGMALIVEDTGNCYSAQVAVERWLLDHPEYKIDYGCEKFMLTFSRGGFLERVA